MIENIVIHGIIFLKKGGAYNAEFRLLKRFISSTKKRSASKKIKSLLSQEIREKTEYAPKYQRNYIWNDTKAVKLIETILINGEVPPLTVVITDGIYEIIDGRQRYETILRFQNNEFSLKAAHLKKLKELDGLTFSQLPPNVRKIFEEYKIKMITYTPERGVSLEWKDIEKIKRDLFRKYNYGMTALSKSEVARAKYLYDDLTNKIRDYLIEHPEQYENYVSLLLPPSKQNLDERE